MMQRLTAGAGGQRNVVTEEKIGVSKPGVMNDMADVVSGVLVRSYSETSITRIIICCRDTSTRMPERRYLC